jgi:hypothetical protein
MQPTTLVVNVKRDAESDAAALRRAASGLGTRRQVIDDIDFLGECF